MGIEGSAPINTSDEGAITNDLLNPKVISKATDSTGRSETAQKIFQARKTDQDLKNSIKDKETESEQAKNSINQSYDDEDKKEVELDNRTKSLIVKLKNLIGVDDKRLAELQTEIDSIAEEREQLISRRFDLDGEIEQIQKERGLVPKPQELLNAYYEKIAHTPLTNEQKRTLLKPEALSQLSTEKYITLWKRLNPYFLSHVTRQGLRDHNSMSQHANGLGEFHNGFVGIMEDEKMLRPPFGIPLKDRSEQTVKNWLSDVGILGLENAADAKDAFIEYLTVNKWAQAPKYPDKTAIHLAAQEIADDTYGGEVGNEIFFIYPTDALISQNNFALNGDFKDLTRKQGEQKWNDVFIWPNSNENPGIFIDAGIAFIPKDTLVNSETGSRYASEIKTIDGEEKRVAVENTELIEPFKQFLVGLTSEQSPIRQAFKVYDETAENYFNPTDKEDKKRELINLISQEMERIGFHQDTIPLINDYIIDLIHTSLRRGEFADEQYLNDYLRKAKEERIFLKRADNTIPAEQYWEQFFAENPGLKPSHVYYYDGDPTTAVYKFQQKHGIGEADTASKDGTLLGFEDHHVEDMDNDPRANQGKEELIAMGSKIIEEHYNSQIDNKFTPGILSSRLKEVYLGETSPL